MDTDQPEPLEKRGVIAPGWTPPEPATPGEKQGMDPLEDHLTRRLADAARQQLPPTVR